MKKDCRDNFPHVFEKLKPPFVRTTQGWKCRCPAHDDTNPSMILWTGKDGRLMFSCFAGCDKGEILRRLGMNWTDLFADHAKKAEPRREVCSYPYCNLDGEVLYETVRFIPKDFRQRRPGPDGKPIWSLKAGYFRPRAKDWESCDKEAAGAVYVPEPEPVVYNWPSMHEALTADPERICVWTEGEKDVETLRALGIVAVTTVGGCERPWSEKYNPAVRGRHFAVTEDHDDAGRRYARTVTGNLVWHHAASVRPLRLKGLGPGQDISDWIFQRRQSGMTDPTIRMTLSDLILSTPAWGV